MYCLSSVLAKIHMVTKLPGRYLMRSDCSVLAKIHMVTKPSPSSMISYVCSVLAKIHMVTKLWSRRFR